MRNHIRVVSHDGLRFQITDAQTAATIPGVRALTVRSGGPNAFATVELECICAEVDVVAALGAVEFVTIHGKRYRFEAMAESGSVLPADVTEIGDASYRRRLPTTGG